MRRDLLQARDEEHDGVDQIGLELAVRILTLVDLRGVAVLAGIDSPLSWPTPKGLPELGESLVALLRRCLPNNLVSH